MAISCMCALALLCMSARAHARLGEPRAEVVLHHTRTIELIVAEHARKGITLWVDEHSHTLPQAVFK